MRSVAKKNPILRYLIGIVGYGGYGLGFLCFLGFIVPFSFLSKPWQKFRERFLSASFQRILHFLTVTYLPWLGVYTIEFLNRLAVLNPPVIYVANHRSRIDGPLLLGEIRRMGALIKSRYARRFPFSVLVKWFDFIAVDAHSITDLRKCKVRCESVLARKKNILIFPEGTRREGMHLLHFHDFAFRLAWENNIRIVPIAIYNDIPFMSKTRGSHFPDRRITYRVRRLPALHPSDYPNPQILCDTARKMIQKALHHMENSV